MRRRDFLTTAGGAAGGAAAVAGGAGTASAQTTHTVEMTDGLKFVPKEITIAPGDTVEFPNVGNVGHSVTAYEDEIPEGAEYWASGGFGSESEARGAWPEGEVGGGETYSHTFETTGTHKYFCIPHESAGMVGTIEVVEGGGGGGGGGGEGGGEVDPEEMGVPIQAHFVGIATLLGIVLGLVFVFYVLKYGESPHASSPNRK